MNDKMKLMLDSIVQKIEDRDSTVKESLNKRPMLATSYLLKELDKQILELKIHFLFEKALEDLK